MGNALLNALIEWNRDTSDRQKLQHIYIVIFVLSLVVAGIVSLVDLTTGQDILAVTAVAGAAFLLNAVVWALLDSTVFTKLANKRKRS